MLENNKFTWQLLSKYRSQMYGIAAIMIVIFHSYFIVPYPYVLPFIKIDLSAITNHFDSGVDIFLLLSGMSLFFSIKKDFKYSSYVKARIIRIFIPYLILSFPYYTLVDLICNKRILNYFLDISGISLFVTYSESGWIFFAKTKWYVTFILIFYLLYPFIFRFLFNGKKDNYLIKSFILIITGFALTFLIKSLISSDYFSVLEIYLTRIPVFLLGCLIGRLVFENEKLDKKIFLTAVISIIIAFILVFIYKLTGYIIIKRYSGFFVAYSFCIIIPCLLELVNSCRLNSILYYFGEISMEIYLIDTMLFIAIIELSNADIINYLNLTKTGKAILYLILFIITIIVGKIFNRFYKKLSEYLHNVFHLNRST